MSDTPETIAVWKETLASEGSWHVEPFAYACRLERERNELRHKLELCMAANSDVERIAMERNALADALRVRITKRCDSCAYIVRGFVHGPTCPHYKTEQKVTQQG